MCLFLESCTNETEFEADPLYEIVPNIPRGMAGSLSNFEKQNVLGYVNNVRVTHNLPVVEYDSRNDRLAQEAALIGVAEIDTAGTLNKANFYFSEIANQEYRNGNYSLWISTASKWPTSEIHVSDWMTELNSENINCRRRILDPFLKSITFGRIIGTLTSDESKHVSSAILVTNGYRPDLGKHQIQYIAYPQGVYNAKFFNPESFLSFSVLYDKNDKSNNDVVDFSQATIRVCVGSYTLEIVEGSVSYDNNNYGLPNNLQWKVYGLTKNTTYTVKITDVKVAGNITNYEYTFIFI
jgi:hypothetical protein